MLASLWQKLGTSLTQGTLVSPPAVWGKLPGQGDYVHHRCSMAERQAWHQWVQTTWPHRNASHTGRKNPPPDAGWMHLSPQADESAQYQLPVAFVLPAGTLPFATRHCVQGVLLQSQDKVGRSCPLIIYQRVSPGWMQRLWAGSKPAMGGQDLLFWWAQLAVRAVHGDSPWNEWLELLDPVWSAHAPGLPHLLGAAPSRADATTMWSLVGPAAISDPASHFHGVAHWPWADWPERALRPNRPTPVFWTQDDEGRYVHVNDSLSKLWRRQP